MSALVATKECLLLLKNDVPAIVRAFLLYVSDSADSKDYSTDTLHCTVCNPVLL